MSDETLAGIYFQLVRNFSTPLTWIEAGMKVRLPDGKKVRITTHDLPNAIMYTLDRDNLPTKVVTIDFIQPWRMPANRVFIASAYGKNLVSLTTVSAVEQNGQFWLICEERLVQIFKDQEGLWSPQLFGHTAEVELLKSLTDEVVDWIRSDLSHPHLQVGQVAFWSWASGTGAICTAHKPDGSAVLSRIFWGNVPERESQNGLRGFNPGEVVRVLATTPIIDSPDTRFKREVVELEF